MRKMILGKTDLRVSIISLGGMVLRQGDQKQADRALAEAAAAGVNYYDSAPTYGDCQELFGNSAVAEKKSFYVGAKSTLRDRAGCMREIEDGLRKLKVDLLDIFHLHAVLVDDDWERIKARGGALEALIKARDKGLVKYIGITGHNDMAVLARALEEFDFDVVMAPINFLYRYFLNAEGALLPVARRKGVGIIGIKPTIQGKALSQKKAYGYVLAQGAHTMIPPGSGEAFRTALKLGDELEPLDYQEERLLLEKAKELDGVCRQCGYCMNEHRRVDICYLFRIEGKFRRFGHTKRFAIAEYRKYTAAADGEGFLDGGDSIFCPWEIDIRQRLRALHTDITASGG